MAVLATERDITTVPKVELHVHLQGSITEATASVLARRHGADPDKVLRLIDGRYPDHFPNFEGFLDTYRHGPNDGGVERTPIAPRGIPSLY